MHFFAIEESYLLSININHRIDDKFIVDFNNNMIAQETNLQEPNIGGELAAHKAYCDQLNPNERCEACT